MQRVPLVVILPAMSNDPATSTESALVTATYSREMNLELASGDVVRARIKGKKLKPVCGDRVQAHAIDNEPEWLITSIDERRNELTRPNMRGKVEVLAANVDFLVVVAASTPTPDWFIVDRYLCAAELMNVDAAVVYNKTDLDFEREAISSELAIFSAAGYETLMCSAKARQNIDLLQSLLAHRISLIVGQSGVGKSSIINLLTADAQQKTGAVSRSSGAGRHTTVNSSMLHIVNDGKVIDSPGVRDYAPAIQSSNQVAAGFREIREAGNSCRFANCQHHKEPGCAVKIAVRSGQISQRRYGSFRRLIVSSEQLANRKY